MSVLSIKFILGCVLPPQMSIQLGFIKSFSPNREKLSFKYSLHPPCPQLAEGSSQAASTFCWLPQDNDVLPGGLLGQAMTAPGWWGDRRSWEKPTRFTLEISENYQQEKTNRYTQWEGRQRRCFVGAEFERFWELGKGREGRWGQEQGIRMHTHEWDSCRKSWFPSVLLCVNSEISGQF